MTLSRQIIAILNFKHNDQNKEDPGHLFVTLDVFVEQVSCFHFAEFTLM